jgi:hypothetical protein
MILKFEMTCWNKDYEDDLLLYKYDKSTMLLRCAYKMHPDDLKAIWICHECKIVFVFHSDVDDHKDLAGHKIIEKVMMISPEETLA